MTRASLGQLPRTVEDNTPEVNLRNFKEQRRAGLIQAIDASAESAGVYLEPAITLTGRELHQLNASKPKHWGTSFDRSIAVIGLIVSLFGLAAGFGLFGLK